MWRRQIRALFLFFFLPRGTLDELYQHLAAHLDTKIGLKVNKSDMEPLTRYLFIDEYENENDDGEPVCQAIPGDGVPVDGNLVAGEESTDGDDAEDVEDGAAHDCADTEVALRHERAHDVRKELRRTRS